MTYTMYWVGKPNKRDESDYVVMAEDWPSIDSSEPIKGTLRIVSGNHTRDEADQIVKAKQRASYSENRRNNATQD